MRGLFTVAALVAGLAAAPALAGDTRPTLPFGPAGVGERINAAAKASGLPSRLEFDDCPEVAELLACHFESDDGVGVVAYGPVTMARTFAVVASVTRRPRAGVDPATKIAAIASTLAALAWPNQPDLWPQAVAAVSAAFKASAPLTFFNRGGREITLSLLGGANVRLTLAPLPE